MLVVVRPVGHGPYDQLLDTTDGCNTNSETIVKLDISSCNSTKNTILAVKYKIKKELNFFHISNRIYEMS